MQRLVISYMSKYFCELLFEFYPSRINLLQFEPLSFAGKLPKKSREEIRQELFLKNRSRKASNKKSRLPKHNEVEVRFYQNPMLLICILNFVIDIHKLMSNQIIGGSGSWDGLYGPIWNSTIWRQ